MIDDAIDRSCENRTFWIYSVLSFNSVVCHVILTKSLQDLFALCLQSIIIIRFSYYLCTYFLKKKLQVPKNFQDNNI